MAPLSITGTEAAFQELHRELTLPALIEFLTLDHNNPTLDLLLPALGARQRPRGAWQITSEMWETMNATWLEAAQGAARAG